MKFLNISRLNMFALFFSALFFTSSFSFGEGDQTRFAVCSHLNRWEFPDVDRELPIIKDAGIGYVRADMDWGQIEPKPGEFNFSRWDAVVEQIKAANMKILPILPGGGVPKRAAPVNEHPEEFANYVKLCVERYKDFIRVWEIYNEPNLESFWKAKPDPVKYAEVLKVGYDQIKAIDPELKVMYAGVAGVPLEYIEESFKAGATKHFDIMNIHPYQYRGAPEYKLVEELKALKDLMKKYGIEDKPIWITEVGESSAPETINYSKFFEAALDKLGIDWRKERVCELYDEDYELGTMPISRAPDVMLPNAKKPRKVSVAQLSELDPKEDKVLLLPVGETFPHVALPALLEYVGNGGTVLFCGGTPFYKDVEIKDGKIVSTAKGESIQKDFHIALNQHWKIEENFPKFTSDFRMGEGFETLKLELPLNTYFASDANLAEGDKMIPVFYGKAKKENGETVEFPLGVIYDFDSTLKGNFVALFSMAPKHISEENQAKMNPRTLILSYSEGIETAFLYNFRCDERDDTREGHFGIVRKNLTPKPSYISYKTMAEMLGEKGRPEVEVKGKTYLASWTRDDGEKIHAIWTRYFKPYKESFDIVGDKIKAIDYMGEKTRAPAVGDGVKMTVRDGITYIIGAKSVRFSDKE